MTRPDSTLIEPRFKDAIDLYVRRHQPTGGFLQNVLANDLDGAIGLADTQALANLPHIVAYIYNEIPGTCWGDPERVRRWLTKGQRRGDAVTPNEMRDLRLGLGMTQDAFARALGVFIRTVQRWESGTTGIPARRADAARALVNHKTSNRRARSNRSANGGA